MKVILPTVWIVVFGGVTAWLCLLTRVPPQMKLVFLAAVFLGAISFYLFCVPLKKVRVDGGNLYVSNFREEITIPLTAVSAVTENRWVNIHPVTIHLRGQTAFGDKIMFMPKQRLAIGWTSHPVVKEITQMAAAASGGEA